MGRRAQADSKSAEGKPKHGIDEAQWAAEQTTEATSEGGTSSASAGLWKVIGGAMSNGALVRADAGLASKKIDHRLHTGTIVKEVARSDNRLRYRLVDGAKTVGPLDGWVTIRFSNGKRLLEALQPGPEATMAGA